jgi:hypothetical protein
MFTIPLLTESSPENMLLLRERVITAGRKGFTGPGVKKNEEQKAGIVSAFSPHFISGNCII